MGVCNRSGNIIEDLKHQIEKAEREYDLNRVAELRYGTMPRLERELQAEEAHLDRQEGESRLLKEEVDEEDIAEVVSRWTGIPISRLLQGENGKAVEIGSITPSTRGRPG